MRRPTSRATDRRRGAGRAGFALVDLMLALAVMALIAALALPRARVADGAAAVRAKAYEAAALLRSDRDAALRTNRTVETVIDPGGRRLRSGAGHDAVSFPDGLPLRFASASGRLRFHPEGRASGGALTIGAGGSALTLEVDPLTAAIRIRSGGSPP